MGTTSIHDIRMVHDLEELSRQFASFFEGLDVECAEALKTKIEKFVKEQEDKKDEVTGLEDEVENLKNEVSDKENEIDKKDDKIEELKEEIEELREKVKDLEDSVESLSEDSDGYDP